MDRNTVIGLVLIFAILISFWFINQPTMEELERQQKAQDSALIAKSRDSVAKSVVNDTLPLTQKDSLADSVKVAGKYGRFGQFSTGANKFVTLENDVIKVKLASKGGALYSVELKKHKRSDGSPVILFEGEYGRFGFSFFTNENKAVSTSDLYFTPSSSDKTASSDTASIDMVLPVAEGKEIRQHYTLAPGSYMLGYELMMNGMQDVVMANRGNFEFEWNNTIPLQEREVKAEKPKTTVYYRFWDDEVESLSETAYEEKSLQTKVQWVSHKQQFFSTTLISQNGIENVKVKTQDVLSVDPRHIKYLGTSFSIPYTYQSRESQKFNFFFSPNHYKTLSQLDIRLQNIVPLGWGIFGWVNQFIVIPIFNFLGQYISSFGIIILLLTLIIKTGLFPLVYKSYISTAKMRVLKPELDELKAKFGGDLQKLNAENMKLYKKAGVNPLGGCLPILLQMPILIALFSFFPSSFELRQQSLWWAHDLSQYDSIWTFGELPIINSIYGDHVSLFTLLMTISTLIYTRMNNQLTGATGQMKWLSYLMPVIFLGVFNSYAAGLTYYYTLSNIVTFGQQFAMRRFVNEDELHRKIQENKKRPDSAIKKSRFQMKLEELAKQQQAAQKQKAQKPKKK